MAVPYILKIKEEVSDIHFDGGLEDKTTHFTYLPHISTGLQQFPVPILTPLNGKKDQNIVNIQLQNNAESPDSYIYQVVYPNQVNEETKPTEKIKRGRKKKKLEEPQVPSKEPVKVLKPAPRTRSGRIVRFPKHMEKDFKKVEIKETKIKNVAIDAEIKTSDFTQFKEELPTKPKNIQQLNFHQRRRKIAAQYRCPKCLKAYLGKTKMIQHIKKYPDHGPLPEKESSKVNFDVWNYLVDITQKCTTAQRGIKFCEELTNLLHNVLLLTSALFKKVEENKNFVEVDKVLGNAIGLAPGFYTFNDSELYKDVTVLKLITTTDFFKPVEQNEPKISIVDIKDVEILKKDEEITVDENSLSENVEDGNFNDQNDLRKSPPCCLPQNNSKINISLDVVKNKSPVYTNLLCKNEKKREAVTDLVDNVSKHLGDVYFNTEDDIRKSTPYCLPQVESKINTNLEDKDETAHIDSELLSDHSLMHLSNIRNTVDELMLTSVDPGGTLLDNSTSSDEVMNVDQFVNERFKKITEPDLELAAPSLNLDLPSLDLFQFHTT